MTEAARLLGDRLQRIFDNSEQVDRIRRQPDAKTSTIITPSPARRDAIRAHVLGSQGFKTPAEHHDSRHVIMPAGTHDPPVRTTEINFTCPHCGSFYEVWRPATTRHAGVGREVTCSVCRGPLPTHDAEFSLEYFLWREAADRGWRRTGPSAPNNSGYP
jgi:predicted RNA-binding Zn-ribbon protein involved in translation (DUF1610 family)